MLHEEFVPEENIQRLQLVHFVLPFAILGVGIIVAAIIFIFELVSGKKKNEINEHEKH